MIEVRISPHAHFEVVDAKPHFANRQTPTAPQELLDHICAN